MGLTITMVNHGSLRVPAPADRGQRGAGEPGHPLKLTEKLLANLASEARRGDASRISSHSATLEILAREIDKEWKTSTDVSAEVVAYEVGGRMKENGGTRGP